MGWCKEGQRTYNSTAARAGYIEKQSAGGLDKAQEVWK